MNMTTTRGLHPKILTQEEMNLVYPSTNDIWANEVGTLFFCEEDDLNELGWLDPWSRPLSKDNLIEFPSEDTVWTCQKTSVKIGPDDCYTINLYIYKKL